MASKASEVLKAVIAENPKSEKNDSFEVFRGRLVGDIAAQRAVEWFFFINMRDQVLGTLFPARPGSPRPRQVEARETTKRISAAVENIKQRLHLMTLTMPNGKELKDCTGAELLTFGNRFKAIADRVGKGRKVGDVLNEDDLQQIMK